MKKLKDYEEDIYKCSRCGLCQSVCPVFNATMNECAVSRGKFNMLNGIIKGELSFSDKIKSYLDLCTGCNACKDFCPSGIDACKIFIAAKDEYYKNKRLSGFVKFIDSYAVFKMILWTAGWFYAVYRFFKIYKIVSLFENCLSKAGLAGKRVVLFNSLARKYIKPMKNQKTAAKTSGIKKTKAVYFDGCFNKYVNSDTKDAVAKLLEKSDIEIIEKDFECCGVSYLFDGNISSFKKLVKRNISQLDEDIDYILTDCASCNIVLKEYENYLSDKAVKDFSQKVLSVTELLKNMKFVCKKSLKIAVHKPCHDNYDFVSIVKNIKNIDFIDVEDYDKCCGFSGKFALKNQEISRKISRKKADKYVDSCVDIILTTCPACVLGLNQGLAEIPAAKKPVVMNLFVFIALFCDVENPVR